MTSWGNDGDLPKNNTLTLYIQTEFHFESMDRSNTSDGTHQRSEKLPQDLQKLVDNEESLVDQLYDGT